MERNKLKRPDLDNNAPERPKRAKSVMPRGMRHTEIVHNSTDEQEHQTRPDAPAHRAEPPRRRPTFDERYRRVTTYIEHDLNERLRRVALESDEVRTITRLLNAALSEYLAAHFPGY